MDAIPPISRGLHPVVRATRPPVKRVERITREDDHPDREDAKRRRGERGTSGEAPGRDGGDEQRPHIDIRV